MKKPPAKKPTAAAPHHVTPAAKHPAPKPTVTKHPAAAHKQAVTKHPAAPAKKPVAAKHAVAKKKPTATKHAPVKHTVAKHVAAKKATLGGQCAWLAFGVKRPWYRRGAQPLNKVAAYAGFVPGPVRAGAVVGIRFPEGYHAARMITGTHADLWGEFVPVTDLDIEESWCLAD